MDYKTHPHFPPKFGGGKCASYSPKNTVIFISLVKKAFKIWTQHVLVQLFIWQRVNISLPTLFTNNASESLTRHLNIGRIQDSGVGRTWILEEADGELSPDNGSLEGEQGTVTRSRFRGGLKDEELLKGGRKALGFVQWSSSVTSFSCGGLWPEDSCRGPHICRPSIKAPLARGK